MCITQVRTCAGVFAGVIGDSQVSGNRQRRPADDRAVRLMQYLTIGQLLTETVGCQVKAPNIVPRNDTGKH